jgi:hypothetical protein
MDMTRSDITASYQGAYINQILQNRSEALVSGIASRGLYLKPKDYLVIYLSLEQFRGPLTINITAPQKPSLLREVESGSLATLNPRRIGLPGADLQIDLTRAEIWQGDPPGEILSSESFPGRYQTISDQAARLSAGHELHTLINIAGAGKTESISPSKGISPLFTVALKTITNNGALRSIGELQELIGLGPGLTPLGDDIILGVLLTLNRWKRLINPNQDLQEINQRLLALAKEKTSRLSYSLFCCAVEGSGDERLLIVLDSFFSGEEPTIEQIQDCLNWGSSSGMGVLAGAFAVITRYLN